MWPEGTKWPNSQPLFSEAKVARTRCGHPFVFVEIYGSLKQCIPCHSTFICMIYTCRWRQGVSDMVLEDGSRAEADRAEERRCSSDRYLCLCIDDDHGVMFGKRRSE